MIKSFNRKETESLFNGTRIRRWVNIEKVAMRKLAMLNQAAMLEDLCIPPNNRLEKLSGDREGLWSIRINDQFRICFAWSSGNAFDALSVRVVGKLPYRHFSNLRAGVLQWHTYL